MMLPIRESDQYVPVLELFRFEVQLILLMRLLRVGRIPKDLRLRLDQNLNLFVRLPSRFHSLLEQNYED